MSHLILVNEAAAPTPAVQPATARPTPMPGPLRGDVTLVVQTAFAQRLVAGRSATVARHGLLGLFPFADMLRSIWRGAEAADPYADWWLVKVEHALDRAGRELQDLQSSLTTALVAIEGLVIAPASSVQPVSTALQFTTPHAFRGAQLIGRCDGIARAVLTARHVGCIPAAALTKTLWRTGHAMRRAFGAARGYRPTGVTRADLANCTPRAAFVVQLMGVLPPAVLNETQRAEFTPARLPASAMEHPTAATPDAMNYAFEHTDLGMPETDDVTATFHDDLGELFPTA